MPRARPAASPSCALCVRAGLCDPLPSIPTPASPPPSSTGYCLALLLNNCNAPRWVLDLAASRTNAVGFVSLGIADRRRLTRALLKSPELAVDKPPVEDTIVWIKQPSLCAAQVQGCMDNSRLHTEHNLHGMCARQGWAIVAYNFDDKLGAAEHGLTAVRAEGIHATELLGF